MPSQSPQFWAALRGDDLATKIKLQDYEVRTALHAAIQAGSLRFVELLLIAGASVHTRDKHFDLLQRCPDTKLDKVNNSSQTMLHFAALYADLRSMEENMWGLSREAERREWQAVSVRRKVAYGIKSCRRPSQMFEDPCSHGPDS